MPPREATPFPTISHQIYHGITIWVLRRGAYDFVVNGAPCEPFSAANNIRPGPRPLRSLEHPSGLPKRDLAIQQSEQVRLGTYCALQTARFLREAHGLGWASRSRRPNHGQGVVSVSTLTEFMSLAGLEKGGQHPLSTNAATAPHQLSPLR